MYYKNQKMLSENAWWNSIKNQFGIKNEENSVSIDNSNPSRYINLMNLKSKDVVNNVMITTPSPIKSFEVSISEKTSAVSTFQKALDMVQKALDMVEDEDTPYKGFIAAHTNSGIIIYLCTFNSKDKEIKINDSLPQYKTKVWKPKDLLETSLNENANPSQQPPGNQPPGNQRPGNQPPGNQPPGNQPPGNQPPGNQPPGNQPSGNQPSGNQNAMRLLSKVKTGDPKLDGILQTHFKSGTPFMKAIEAALLKS